MIDFGDRLPSAPATRSEPRRERGTFEVRDERKQLCPTGIAAGIARTLATQLADVLIRSELGRDEVIQVPRRLLILPAAQMLALADLLEALENVDNIDECAKEWA